MTPEYILNNWTNEELATMIEKLVERKNREVEAIQGHSTTNIIPDEQFFNQAGIKYNKVKK